MENLKYVKANEAVVRGEGSDYVIKNYITNADSQNVSLAVSTLNGKASTTRNTKSDRLYYFFEGEAEFQFEDKVIKIEKNSTLLIPKNTKYKMSGFFKAVLVNSPAFNISDEEHFD